MECLPFESSPVEAYPHKSMWDAAAAELVATMLGRWHLTADRAFVGGEVGSVLRVRQSDGAHAVLKVGFPHFEGVWEAVGLELMQPVAPRVLRQDPWTWSLLIEEVVPGLRMLDAAIPSAEALDSAATVLAGIHSAHAPGGMLRLDTVIGSYASSARARLPEQRAELGRLGVADLVERAIGDSLHLAADQVDHTLLHGDFNPGNLLLDEGGSWRVIDPKPMIGDPAFDPAPMLAQVGDPWSSPDPVSVLRSRFEQFCDLARLDAHRAAHWAFVRSAYDVSWLLDDGTSALAESSASRLRTLARLL